MSKNQLTFPVQEFRHIVQACRADEPLGPEDPRFADLTPLRAGSSIVEEFSGSLEQELEENQFYRGIVAGHRGSGKSTELLQLKSWADENGFLCLRVEVENHLGSIQPEFSDLYLLAAEIVTRGMVEIGKPLPQAKLEKVLNWFAEITKQDLEKIKSEAGIKVGAQIGGGIPGIGKLFSNFTAGIAANSEHQLEVKRVFRQAPNQLIDITNDLIQSANEQLMNSDDETLRRSQGVLLLFDNLDRYSSQSIEELLTHGATLMGRLACHAIYTIPVELRCKAGNVISDNFDDDVILPMPSLRVRDTAWSTTVEESEFDPGSITCFTELLGKRLDINHLFEYSDDAQLLIKMSGGCVRDLMKLVNASRQKSGRTSNAGVDTPAQITHLGVIRAISMLRDNQADGLLEEDYCRLAKVARRDPTIQHLDDHTLRLLGRRCVLRYKDDKGQWLDVHPLLIETEGFRRAYELMEEAAKKESLDNAHINPSNAS